MVIAVLFNSDDPKYDGYYGYPIQKAILETGVLQNANRHMKILIGDVTFILYAKTREELTNMAEQTFFGHPNERLLSNKLRGLYNNSTIFAWVIENVTDEICQDLHDFLINDSGYLGIHVVDFSFPLHLVLYHNCMIERYRIIGKRCSIFYSMGNGDEINDVDIEEMRGMGFENVNWEDSGARKTIFDDYDTLEHFKQVDEFVDELSKYFDDGEYGAYELSMVISDINPKLFNTLGAMVRAIRRVQNEEDIAQVGLSGRRYLEQLSDVLFAPRDEEFNGRSVAKEKHKNRLWAYIEESYSSQEHEEQNTIILGKEVDRLFTLFNSALHAEVSKDRITQGFADVAKLTVILLTLQPMYSKDPYYAYSDKIISFIKNL